MRPHVNAIANGTDAEATRTILAVGNMGRNALIGADALIRVASDARRPVDVRVNAVKALKEVANVRIVRDQLATLLNDPSLHLTIITVASKFTKQNDDLDAAISRLSASSNAEVAEAARAYSGHGTLTRRNIKDLIPKDWAPITDSKWDSSKSAAFDIISPLSKRKSDSAAYPYNAAGLVGVNLGFDNLRLRASGGVFAGYGKEGCLVPDFKTFAGAKVSADAFGKRYEILDAEASIIKGSSPAVAAGKVYINFNGKTMVAQDIQFDCRAFNRPVTDIRTQVATFKYKIPIYIATIEIEMTASASLKADVEARACAQPSATAIFRPTVGASIKGS
ncbi:hypothetical protein HDU67_005638, partial [Dinochytrium kinnereticum]